MLPHMTYFTHVMCHRLPPDQFGTRKPVLVEKVEPIYIKNTREIKSFFCLFPLILLNLY